MKRRILYSYPARMLFLGWVIVWVGWILLKQGLFDLPGRKRVTAQTNPTPLPP